jgi:hypothetical protein
MKNTVFWVVTPCSEGTTRRLRGIYCLHLQDSSRNKRRAEILCCYPVFTKARHWSLFFSSSLRPIFSLVSLFWNKKFWEQPIVYFPWYDTGHTENEASNNSSIVVCVFVTAVTFLPSRCLATIRGLLSRCLAAIREYLPSRCLATKGDTQTHTQTAKWSPKGLSPRRGGRA